MNDSDLGTVYRCAASLLSDDDDNPEYDRALAELVTDLTGIDMGNVPIIARTLRIMKEAQ